MPGIGDDYRTYVDWQPKNAVPELPRRRRSRRSRRYLDAEPRDSCGVSSSNTAMLDLPASKYVQVRVDGVTMREEGLAGKPAPDSFLRGAQLLDVSPDQAAVFEDAIAGVAAGRDGHFGVVIGVDRVGQAEALRRNGADIVVADLAELLDAR